MLPNWGFACRGNGVGVHSYAHPLQEKVLKHLIFVYDGCGMVNSLKQSVAECFEHFYITRDKSQLSQIWGYTFGSNCIYMCPSTTREGVQTPGMNL
jgi:hypothetical protein